MKKHIGFIFVFILGFLPLVPMIHPGLPVTHDGQDHVARIANFYLSLTEGNIVPRWAGNLNWGYGHPILMFLYPFPSYFSSLFHFLGFSLIDSVKLVFGISYILSGIGMYLWIKSIWGEKAGIISGVVYMYAPYRFVDLYVRGAIGEHVAFLFAPFICFFLIKLSRNYSYFSFLGLSLSVAGLILSHNAVTIMLLPVIFLYFLTLVSKKNKKFTILATASLILGIGLSFFFVYPAFFEGKYTLRDIITGGSGYRNSFVPFIEFFSFSWNFGGSQLLSKQIGIPILIGLFASLYLFFKRKKERMLIGVFGGSVLFAVFLMTFSSDFIWQNISLIQKFQFPWRFLTVVVFSGSVLCGMIVGLTKVNKLKDLFFFGIVIVAVISSSAYIKVNSYFQKPESFFTEVYLGTTDTGESAPIWSVRFMEKKANKPVEVIEGESEILNYSKTTTSRRYTIQAGTPSRIRENTLYFPNWEVYINNKKVPIEYQDPQNRGLITYFVPQGKSEIKITFNDTKQRIFANLISVISILFLIGFIFIPKKYKKYGT